MDRVKVFWVNKEVSNVKEWNLFWVICREWIRTLKGSLETVTVLHGSTELNGLNTTETEHGGLGRGHDLPGPMLPPHLYEIEVVLGGEGGGGGGGWEGERKKNGSRYCWIYEMTLTNVAPDYKNMFFFFRNEHWNEKPLSLIYSIKFHNWFHY